MKLKNLRGKKILSLGHKESDMDYSGMKPRSAW